MIIKSIELQNIRSHENSKLEFKEGITVLSGKTGSGKSSFLIAVEYALFGSESGIPNNEVLSRGKNKGLIKLEFMIGNDVYTVIRGLKKKGDNILADTDNLIIIKNNTIIPLMGRSNDINEKIMEIINYPKEIKGRELFEAVNYTKQDEIRKLIELNPEKRQDYIDRILQLSKYKLVWENMKELISRLKQNIAVKDAEVRDYEAIKQELVDKKEELKQAVNKRQINQEKYERNFEDLEKINKEISKKESNAEESIKKHEELIQLKINIENAENELESKNKVSADLEKEINESKKKINTELDYKKLNSLSIEREKDLEKTEERISEIIKEADDVKKLSNNCPLCKQEIDHEHKKSLLINYDSKIKELRNNKIRIEKEIEIIKKDLVKAEESKEIKEILRIKEESLKDKKEEINVLKNKIKDFKLKIDSLSKSVLNPQKIKEEIDNLKDSQKELEIKSNVLKESIKNFNERIDELNNSISIKEEAVKKIETQKALLKVIKRKLDIFSRLREDIKNIREVVRNRFLEDFRNEFQKRFEEIRKDDDEYVVDIKNDYEPVAFTKSGDEAGISGLSGGEKTSVALAYRLALSSTASLIEGVSSAKFIILDEPTTGFDKDDVKSLPYLLRSINNIPQIIIVTHEEDLKDMADYKHEITKTPKGSKIT